ncbi:MAG: NAD-dependent epimerase [Candidatus Tokpelaia hoelldobleri]|uniref:NAD-dependent epimerase n=1 Tax=Candidatus Tokpelaia hoelldobleri TaxID=1902579 RepID=A0A1U9JT46_9HYPH|nr:MAG: NAD-dependent epimerase [Candidatus Tokpelaia hoelldoblerii]
MTPRILLTGAGGQIGSELALALAQRYGRDAVIISDIREGANPGGLHYEQLDVMDAARLAELLEKYGITQIYHLAATLSAVGEQKPQFAWTLNMGGLLNVLESAVAHGVKRVFWPSSIGAFGPSTPVENTPQGTIMEPQTIYGISKLAGEGWCRWYFLKKGLDVRSVRYPGLISYKAPPGGGTTDYAVDIFHSAVAGKPYRCFLKPQTSLPMMYMPDAVAATIALMEADSNRLTVRDSYNLAAISFTPEQIAAEIARHIPGFQVEYAPDYRQQIADSWPDSIDDSTARKDWGWQPAYDLAAMTRDMLENLRMAT